MSFKQRVINLINKLKEINLLLEKDACAQLKCISIDLDLAESVTSAHD